MPTTPMSKFLLISLLFAAAFNAVGQDKPGMQRSVLLQQQVDLPSSDINAKVMRVVFQPGFKTPWHTHEGPGPRYVVKGQLKVTEGGKSQTFSAGEVFWESGALMAVENVGQGVAELVIFEMAPAK